jgi:hypothetical protein
VDQEQHPPSGQLRIEAERLVAQGRWTLRLTTHVATGGIGAVGIMPIRDGEAVTVRFWDFKADAEKLASPDRGPGPLTPTIHERQFLANAAHSKSLVGQLALLKVPLLPEPSSYTIDGVLYEIYCELGQHSTTLRWVSTAPQGWETVGVWFQAAWTGLSNGIGPADPDSSPNA